MAVNIGPKIGIEGEAEYRKQINGIIQQSKTLAAEMKKLTSSFDKEGKSVADNAKQRKILNEQIENQKSRVKELTTMLDKSEKAYGENATETLKWKQAVYEAEAQLNKLEGDLKSLPSSLDLVAARMANMGEKLEAVGNKVASVGSKLTSTLTTGIVGAFGAAVKITGDFDAAMSKVQAVSGATAEDLEKLRAKAKEMGETTKFSAAESAEALNYMAMAGWKPEQMLNGIEGIMNLAAASGEELGNVSDIVTDALTAFGMTAEESGRFSDILAAAASNANTNVAMMGESFKYAASTGGALGYTAEDVAIALGLMANSGIKADMAGTTLRNIFQRMATEPKQAAAAMERLGVSLADDTGRMYTLREIMNQLRDSFSNIMISAEEYEDLLGNLDKRLEDGIITQKQYDKELEELNRECFGAEGAEKARTAAMLGGARAMSGLLAIANAAPEDYEKLTEAIDDSSQVFAKLKDGSILPLNEALKSGQEIVAKYNGTAEAMAGQMLDNLPGQVTILKSQIQALAIAMGEILMPTIRSIVGRVQGFVDSLNAMDDEEKKHIMKIAALVASIGPLLMVGGKLMVIIGKVMQFAPAISTAVQGIGAALGAISAPVLAIAAALGVAVAAFMHLWKTNDSFREGMMNTWNGIKESFSGFISAIQERMPQIQEAFSNIIAVLGPMWDKFCQLLGPMFQGAFDFIKIVLDAIFNAIIGVIDMLTGIFTADKELFMQGLQTFGLAIWNYILQFWMMVFTWIINTANVFLGWFGTSLGEIVTKIVEFFKGLWDTIVEKVTEIVDWVTEKINEICDFISSLPDRFYQWGVEMIQNLAQGIRDTIGAVTEAISSVAEAIAEFIHFSEPDVGPLSHFNSFMPDMMKQMAQGIEKGRWQVQAAAANVARDIAAPIATTNNVTLNNSFTFGGGYTEADGRDIVRKINRQLGALYI